MQVDLIQVQDKVKSANGKRRSNPFSCRVPPLLLPPSQLTMLGDFLVLYLLVEFLR